MAEQTQQFPKTLFSKDEKQNPVTDSVTGEVLCGSRAFQSQEEVDAAGGTAVWKDSPQEASQSQQQPQTGAQQPLRPGQAPPLPPPPPEPEGGEDLGSTEPPAPRSRR